MEKINKLDKSSWPVLFVSDKLKSQTDATDEQAWLHEIVKNLIKEQYCSVILSYSYTDAEDIIYSRQDLGTIILDRDMEELGRLHKKNLYFQAKSPKKRITDTLIEFIRKTNTSIPILLLTDRGSIEDISDEILASINGIIWKLTESTEFLAGRIGRSVVEYSMGILPPFFKTLIEYVNQYKYAWHTPGHMGGEGFMKSPSGTAFHKFFGENTLRSDLSISVSELGSLLDHSGVTGEAEKFSAKVFGADETYYVLNGTSTSNQIIWRSQISPGEISIVDRNCHKSLNHAMIITSAKPHYMAPMRNALGIIGPVDFDAINKKNKYKMFALTNSTYDGVCYDTSYIERKLDNVEILHFDEAWYAYAKFHPIYHNHFGMCLSNKEKLVFCSQSTHKLLTAFSQSSMIHVKFPKMVKISEDAQKNFHDLFNESYMIHGSTSPQYSMVASLEVATKMMADSGETAFTDTIVQAIELRKKIVKIQNELKEKDDWFFGIWQPDYIINIPTDELAKNQQYWKIKCDDKWHGFDVKADYTMLDPIKLTFTCPGIRVNGDWDENGIPASIVTNYLVDKGIVCEKTDYYSWLLLNSLGNSKGKQGTLVAELLKFKGLYDKNAPLRDIFPSFTSKYPKKYSNKGLKEHCQEMHDYIKENKLLEKMNKAFKLIPTQKLIPGDAYRNIVKNNVEFVELRHINIDNEPRIAGVMLVPYPPGIPIIMGGEEFNKESQIILEYLIIRQNFENEFPGYESDIHGIERTAPDEKGNRYFKTLLIKPQEFKNK